MDIKDFTKITKNMNVLFVDDEPGLLETTQNVFKSTIFPNTDIASNGLEALDKIHNKNYDLVITDLEMPIIDGYELIKKIKELNPNIFIIVLSATKEHDKVLETMNSGIDGFLFKPLNFEKLIEILNTILVKVSANEKISLYEKTLEELVERRTEDLKRQLNTDSLTKLGTLSSLINKLDNLDNFKSPVLILVNIDNFSLYNQLYGFETGNQILCEFANFLKEFNKDNNYELFRINADEFVLLDISTYLDIMKYERDMNSLFDSLKNKNFKPEGIEENIQIEITAGISFSSTQCLKKANIALYEAKKNGRDYLGFSYDLDQSEDLEKNIHWRKEIKNAISENRILAFYQPIVDRDQQVVQYESFIRIKKQKENGELEYFAPGEFLDLSIMTKQYSYLTKFMIETTLAKMSERNVPISINLTYQDIKNNDIYVTLKETIKKYHMENRTEFDISNNVIFEILEKEGVDCYLSFVDFIKEFKEMGVKIALDDFGTGFSNFSHISSLNPDFIKIDGELIKSVNKNDKSLELVKAIVKFSKELEIKTIAEHVQNEETFDILFDLGVDKFQGFYFGKPKADL